MPFQLDQSKNSFIGLTDTPSTYVAGQTLRANSTGDSLEFYVPSSGGGGAAIDDSSVSTTTTYSSSKIVSELSTKASTASVNTKLSLTGGSLTGDVTTNVPNGSFSSTSLVTKNYVDNAVGGATGATTYTALTDTPSTHSANALLYSTGSAIAHTTTQIAIDGNGIEVNQLNARVDGTSNIGDSSHKFNNVFCTNIHQGNVKLVVPSVRGTTGQYVKVSNATNETHTLEFADVINDAAASSTTTYSSTKIDQELDDKADKSAIQTTAEGNSTSETDVYSCNSVFTKNEIGTAVNTQALTLNNTTGAGILNFGSNQTSGNYANLQTYANGTRYSSQQWYTTSGNANVDWYFMKSNSLTKTINIRPNDRNQTFEVLTGGIKGETLSMRDGFITARLGNYGSSSAGRYGLVITPLVNTINSEIELRGLRSTGILSDFYTNHLSGSTLTLQSRLATNRHSTTHANIEVSTYQNGSETKVLDIGASSGSAKTITITGTTHSTGHVTTDQTTFSNNNELVTKQYVDTQDATKLSLTGGSMTGHISTNQTTFSNTQLVTRSYTDTKVAALIDDSIYRTYLVWSSTKTRDTINGLIDDTIYRTTNVWSSTKTRNEIISAAAAKLDLTGGAMTGHITTNQTTFSANNQLVTKQYVDAQIVAGGGASQFTQLTDTPSSYTANRFLKSTGSALDWFELNSKTLTWDFYNALSDLPSASANHGMLAHVHAEAAVYYAHNGAWVKLANDSRVNSSVANITLSGADLSVTRQDGTAFLVTGVNPPALSWAVTAGTVSSDGSSLQLTQTNNGSAPNITGLTPNTVADTCYTSSNVLSGGGLQFTKKDGSTVVHPAVLLPPVSSGTNQYVLANNGTNAEWMSTITASASTLNFGTSTIKNFMSWALGYFGSYFLRATPSNGDTLGSIFFGDTGLNYYSMLSGKVDNTTGGSQQGHVSVSAAKSGTMTEQLIVGKSDHSNADAGQFAGTLKVAGVKFSGNTTQTKPVEDPTTVGHVLTATAGGNWQWAAASGGGSSYSGTLVDTQSTGASGVTAITNNNSQSATNRWGAMWGLRSKTWTITDELHHMTQNGRGRAGGMLANGSRGFTSTKSMIYDTYIPYYQIPFGHVTFTPHSEVRYNFTRFYTTKHATTTTTVMQTNHEYRILASNDGANWVTLHTFAANTMTRDTSRENVSDFGIYGSSHPTTVHMVYTSWTNANYYSMWRIQHVDLGNSSYMVDDGDKLVISCVGAFMEYEWG